MEFLGKTDCAFSTLALTNQWHVSAAYSLQRPGQPSYTSALFLLFQNAFLTDVVTSIKLSIAEFCGQPDCGFLFECLLRPYHILWLRSAANHLYAGHLCTPASLSKAAPHATRAEKLWCFMSPLENNEASISFSNCVLIPNKKIIACLIIKGNTKTIRTNNTSSMQEKNLIQIQERRFDWSTRCRGLGHCYLRSQQVLALHLYYQDNLPLAKGVVGTLRCWWSDLQHDAVCIYLRWIFGSGIMWTWPRSP